MSASADRLEEKACVGQVWELSNDPPDGAEPWIYLLIDVEDARVKLLRLTDGQRDRAPGTIGVSFLRHGCFRSPHGVRWRRIA